MPTFRRGLCVTCYRHARRDGTITLHPLRPATAVVEDVEWMIATGETHPEAIATRLGYLGPAGPDSLRRALHRGGRPDLAARLNRTKDEAP